VDSLNVWKSSLIFAIAVGIVAFLLDLVGIKNMIVKFVIFFIVIASINSIISKVDKDKKNT